MPMGILMIINWNILLRLILVLSVLILESVILRTSLPRTCEDPITHGLEILIILKILIPENVFFQKIFAENFPHAA
jgi:hypothetical protein